MSPSVKFSIPNEQQQQQPKAKSVGGSSTKYGTTKQSTKTGSSTVIHVKTCCGMLEFDCLRLVSILGMLLNVVAFIIIAGVVIKSYTVMNNPQADLLTMRGDALNYCLLMEESTRHACYSNNLVKAKEWYTYRDGLIDSIQNILDILKAMGSAVDVTIVDKSTMSPQSFPLIDVEQKIISLVESGQPDAAKALFLSNTTYISNYTGKVFQTFLNVLKTEGRFKDSVVNSTSITTVSVVGVNLAIIIPIIIIVFGLTIRSESVSSNKMKTANLLLLFETIANGGMRELFRNYCVSQAETDRDMKVLNLYMFLEKVQYYKELCLKLFEIQIKMEKAIDQVMKQEKRSPLNSPLSNVLSNSSNDSLVDSTQNLNLDIIQVAPNDSDDVMSNIFDDFIDGCQVYTAEDVEKIEKEKYEIAFEIFSEHLDPKTSGDSRIYGLSNKMINKVKEALDTINQNPSDSAMKIPQWSLLKEDFFDKLQQKVGEGLLTHHEKFKQSLAMNSRVGKQTKGPKQDV